MAPTPLTDSLFWSSGVGGLLGAKLEGPCYFWRVSGRGWLPEENSGRNYGAGPLVISPALHSAFLTQRALAKGENTSEALSRQTAAQIKKTPRPAPLHTPPSPINFSTSWFTLLVLDRKVWWAWKLSKVSKLPQRWPGRHLFKV